jgi:hypothetical protein
MILEIISGTLAGWLSNANRKAAKGRQSSYSIRSDVLRQIERRGDERRTREKTSAGRAPA